MCGFAGFWQPVVARPLSPGAISDRVGRMVERLEHRGPDDRGRWVDAQAGIAMGFRRLAIRDLSPAGAQPMVSASGHSVMTFNGEIYNVGELRDSLKSSVQNFNPRGTSDTEVLLESIEAWGLEETLKKCVGMFALAVWDRRDRTLRLARDRFGEKPLYYGVHNGVLLFGSELKALREHSAFRADIDRTALAGLARHGYVPGPGTIYRDTSKLPAATILTLREREVSFSNLPAPCPYWRLEDHLQSAATEPFQGDESEAVSELDQLLHRTVRDQMVADVPLGAFLSGGIDSSLVVAMMQSESSRPIRTFTIGFDVEQFNEAPHAAAVAKHLGTDHTECLVTAEQARDVIPRLPEIYDEPFADSSQIPTFLVSQLARKHVTVSLSGDGGDELFGGYARYAASLSMWNRVGWIPRPLRRAAALALQGVPGLETAERGTLRRKLLRAAPLLDANSFDDAYRLLISSWKSPGEAVVGGVDAPSAAAVNIPDRYRRMMFRDARNYLPDDILVKVDRATMAVSLESRAPFLDHRIAEFAARLPTSLLYRRPQGKRILRTLLERYVPRSLFERPKMGFGVPIGAWLRGPLRDWADDLLSVSRLHGEGHWRANVVRAAWASHASGKSDESARLWPVLMFQTWHANQKAALGEKQAA